MYIIMPLIKLTIYNSKWFHIIALLSFLNENPEQIIILCFDFTSREIRKAKTMQYSLDVCSSYA
jgi:hypothetical protein